MQNEILINATAGETRVAIIERGTFVDLYIERTGSRSVVGSVIKGRVNRVLPGMQAAFVDIGLEKAAFLYVGDYVDEGKRRANGGGRRRPGAQPASIETVLEQGQEIVVQVAKEPIGTKGARITSNLSIAGRHLVLTPWSTRVGVSRRIEGDRERSRLREVVERSRPKELGFIIRTAGEAARDADLEADVRYLSAVWEEIERKKEELAAPATLYAEPSLPIRVIRDFANLETKRIVVDSPAVYEEMSDFVTRFVADPKPIIELHEQATSIFRHFGVEKQIDTNLERKVWLKSGGYLIIDQTEALTSIDVNTGRFVGKRNLEETVLKTNLEAVREVAYQLRFRNIGGLIIIDLIDMEPTQNRDKVYRALLDELRKDKAKTNVLPISELGLVEMTRKRTRENLVQTVCEPCPYCDGRSFVLSRDSVAYKVLRELRTNLARSSGRHVAISVNPRVAALLLNTEQKSLDALAREFGREIEIRAKPGMHQSQFEFITLDKGPAVELSLPWLPEQRQEQAASKTQTEPYLETSEEGIASDPLETDTSPEILVESSGSEDELEQAPPESQFLKENETEGVGKNREDALHSQIPNESKGLFAEGKTEVGCNEVAPAKASHEGSEVRIEDERVDNEEYDDFRIEQYSEEQVKS